VIKLKEFGVWSLSRTIALLRYIGSEYEIQTEWSNEDIYAWVNEHVQYVPDPDREDVFQTPPVTIELGTGDCEDFSLLVCALAYPRPCVLRIYFSDRVPRHIAPIVDGEALDLAAALPIGVERPGYNAVMDVRIR
jgi:hypothetical protein